jgi:hypothetical protein
MLDSAHRSNRPSWGHWVSKVGHSKALRLRGVGLKAPRERRYGGSTGGDLVIRVLPRLPCRFRSPALGVRYFHMVGPAYPPPTGS